jgi:hypothetical protein
MVLFYCEIPAQDSPMPYMPSSLRVERKRSETEISLQELREITSFGNSKLARRNLKERFALGSSLWLIRSADRIAGYGWTLQGRTVEPHFFRLGKNDVHLFDFLIFPQYRGRGLNPLLVSYILAALAIESQGRAFIEAAEWNQAQLTSLQRTPFHLLSSATKVTILGRSVVCWGRGEAVEEKHEFKNSALGTTGSKQRCCPKSQG